MAITFCSHCNTQPEMIIKHARIWVQDGVTLQCATRRALCKKCFDELFEEDRQGMILKRNKLVNQTTKGD